MRSSHSHIISRPVIQFSRNMRSLHYTTDTKTEKLHPLTNFFWKICPTPFSWIKARHLLGCFRKNLLNTIPQLLTPKTKLIFYNIFKNNFLSVTASKIAKYSTFIFVFSCSNRCCKNLAEMFACIVKILLDYSKTPLIYIQHAREQKTELLFSKSQNNFSTPLYRNIKRVKRNLTFHFYN